jgi:hypothetical protein
MKTIKTSKKQLVQIIAQQVQKTLAAQTRRVVPTTAAPSDLRSKLKNKIEKQISEFKRMQEIPACVDVEYEIAGSGEVQFFNADIGNCDEDELDLVYDNYGFDRDEDADEDVENAIIEEFEEKFAK